MKQTYNFEGNGLKKVENYESCSRPLLTYKHRVLIDWAMNYSK